MKKTFKLLAAGMAVALTVGNLSALACTGLYVGKDVSAEGTALIARSEDISPADYNKLQFIQPRVENEPGRTMDDINGLKLALPDTTYAYTYLSDHTTAGDGLYAAVCTNEKGVSVTGTVSASPCDAFKEADPRVKGGLREAILPAAVAATAATALEGVQNLLGFVDTYGSAEGNVVMVADQKEAWIVEIYGGHQYAAMKMPDDQVAVFGNQFMLGAVDPKATVEEGYLFSKDLFTTLDTANLAVKSGTQYLLAQSVCGNTRSDSSNMRTWVGHTLLAPSSVKDYNTNTFYPLFYAPDQKVSLADVMAVYRNRYEGTKYDMNLAGNEAMRPIAVSTNPETHILQVYSDLPAQFSTVNWLAMGGGEHAPFLPVWSGVTELHPAYQVDGAGYRADSLYWAFKNVCGLADTNRALYSGGVQDFWTMQEQEMTAQAAKTAAAVKAAAVKAAADPADIAALVTAFSMDQAEAQYKNANVLSDGLLTTLIHNVGLSATKTPLVFVSSAPLALAAAQKGYTMSFDAVSQVVTLKNNAHAVSLTVGSKTYIDNGVEHTLSQAPALSQDVVFVPMDFVQGL